MQIKKNKLAIIFLVLFVAVLVIRVFPALTELYRLGQNEITRLENRIERNLSLQLEQPQLEARLERQLDKVAMLESWVFAGGTENLVGSNVQQELRRASLTAGVSVREMGVADYDHVDGWLVVNQEMTFTIEQNNILQFLNLLEDSIPKLYVTEFSIARNRREFTGSLSVVGFSRYARNEIEERF